MENSIKIDKKKMECMEDQVKSFTTKKNDLDLKLK